MFLQHAFTQSSSAADDLPPKQHNEVRKLFVCRCFLGLLCTFALRKHESSRGSEKRRKYSCQSLLKHSNENHPQNEHVTSKSTENAKDFRTYLEQTEMNSHKVRHRGAVDRKSETCEIRRLHGGNIHGGHSSDDTSLWNKKITAVEISFFVFHKCNLNTFQGYMCWNVKAWLKMIKNSGNHVSLKITTVTNP